MTFPQFASLPSELQLQIWEACMSSHAMHIFDVCSPPMKPSATMHVSAAEESHLVKGSPHKTSDELGVTVFLDALSTSPDPDDHETRVTSYGSDPSMYHFETSLRRTTRASKSTVLAVNRANGNIPIHLPLQGRMVEIPRSDVLMLRFRQRSEVGVAAARTIFRDEESSSSTLGEILEGQWSPQMAQTLRSATKIAFDLTESWIAELGSELAYEEITFLACTLQQDLEVLYLVDNCAGRCTACGSGHLQAKDLQRRGILWECLNYQDKYAAQRRGDVIEAVSKRYIEVSDLESLGWNNTHPSFIFARMIDELIRGQQHGKSQGKFKGVRVLVVEEDAVQEHARAMKVRCKGPRSKDSALDLAMGLLPAYAGVWNE